MGRKLDLPDYYYHMRRVADTYDVSENHAACFICQYITESVCGKCPRKNVCMYIYEKETDGEGEK